MPLVANDETGRARENAPPRSSDARDSPCDESTASAFSDRAPSRHRAGARGVALPPRTISLSIFVAAMSTTAMFTTAVPPAAPMMIWDDEIEGDDDYYDA